MPTTTFRKVFATALTFALVSVVGISVATAGEAQAEGTASIGILESLEVTEQEPMNFGYVHRPSEGENTLVLSHQGDEVEANGSGDAQYVDGSSTSGVYSIAGEPERSVQMSVIAEDFEDSSIHLEETFIDGSEDESVGQLDDSGQYEAGIGGVVTIDSDASVGNHTTDVMVTVEYE